MALKKTYAALFVLAAVFAVSCEVKDREKGSPFDNHVYLNVAEYTNSDRVFFTKTVTEDERSLYAVLVYPAGNDVEVTIKPNASLVSTYNAKNATNYKMLAAGHYEISGNKVKIPAGKTTSEPLDINFQNLDGLEIDETFLLPVTIDNATGGMEILGGSRTVYYLVKRSSAITVAANLKDNFMTVPGFKTPEGAAAVNDMPSITYEALIDVHDYEYPAGSTITTIMGVEQHFLMRLGDVSFPRMQLQVQGPVGKFPKEDKSKSLTTNTWYHVALTWDIPNGVIIFYINGEEQSRDEKYATSDVHSISLAAPDATYPFYIGHSFENVKRQLNGNISECRIWSVARTQQEIWENMYNVDPQTPGLAAYWKFDEGEGDIVYDRTGNGNHAQSDQPIVWPRGIEIPQLNKED